MGEVRTVEVAGASLVVREWGAPAGRPILLWHALGLVVTAALYGELEPALGSEWRLVAPDAPGFGGSAALPPERYEIGELAALFWALADDRGLERPVLAGHSWGGVVACAAAAAQPGRAAGLVLLDSGHRDYQDGPGFTPGKTLAERTAEAVERRLRLPSWDALWRELEEGEPAPLGPSLREAIAVGVREEGGEIVGVAAPEALAAAQHGLGGLRASSTWPALARAGLPVLLLLATRPDDVRTANEAAAPVFSAAVPAAEVRFVADGSHTMLTDKGPEVAEILRDWLARAPAA